MRAPPLSPTAAAPAAMATDRRRTPAARPSLGARPQSPLFHSLELGQRPGVAFQQERAHGGRVRVRWRTVAHEQGRAHERSESEREKSRRRGAEGKSGQRPPQPRPTSLFLHSLFFCGARRPAASAHARHRAHRLGSPCCEAYTHTRTLSSALLSISLLWCSLPPSTAQMDGALFAALSGALSHVGPDRGACEANLKALADQPGFCSALLVRADVGQGGGLGASKKS